MPRPRVILPQTERVDLDDGDWLELRKELSYGESLELSNAARLDSERGGQIDLRDYYLLRAALSIVDWSFVDSQNIPIAWDDGLDDTRSALQTLERRKDLVASLDAATGAAIQQAINAMEEKAQAGRAPKIEGTMEQKTEPVAPPKITVARSSR